MCIRDSSGNQGLLLIGGKRSRREATPLTGTWWWVPIAVLLIAIALEGFSFRTAKAPELPVILLEDVAALFGLVFALFGVSMHQIAAAIDAAEQRARTAVPGLGLV